MTSENHNIDDQPVLTIIQRIKDGLFDPKLLSKDQRQQCVEVLSCEGLTEVSIAQILKVSTKTITRDIQVIRDRNALEPNVDLVKQLVGELLQYARIHRAYLMRLARSKDASVSDKIQAEYYSWLISDQCIKRMQSLGYAPERLQGVDIFHHVDDQEVEKSFQNARVSLNEVINIAQQSGALTPQLEESVRLLQERVEKVEIVHESKKLSLQSGEIKEESHDKQNS